MSPHPIVLALAAALVAGAVGCGDATPKTEAPAAPPSGAQSGAPLLTKKVAADWCGEHGVPESVCTRCNESLVAGFKEKGDWCEAHGVPESQCFVCDPLLEAKFKALAPADSK